MRLFCLFVIWALLSTQVIACGVSCPDLLPAYELSGCYGQDQCTLEQTSCQLRFACKQTLQECIGVMTDGVINMRCVDEHSQNVQAVASRRKDNKFHITFIPPGKPNCEGELTPSSP